MTYCALGMIFGLFGKTLLLAGIQRWVSISLGVVLIVGLFTSRKLALWKPVTAAGQSIEIAHVGIAAAAVVVSVGALGLLNGLLPCGLVYVAAAGATATGHILNGAIYMAAFGAGTLPMMLAIGLGGKLVPLSFRLKLRAAIPVSVFLLGTLLILRGMSLGIPYVSPDLVAGSCCHKLSYPLQLLSGIVAKPLPSSLVDDVTNRVQDTSELN